jgi:23S rRNA pseudouridine1911/1915/1917 synthase
MQIIIKKEQAGIRIDKFLTKELLSFTRGEIIRSIKGGNVLMNGKKVKPSYVLKSGDKLEINVKKEESKLIPNKKIELNIIYQDKNIIAIDKPAGLQVHPSTISRQVPEKNTLVNYLIYKFPEIKKVGDEPNLRPGIVHRLDKDTSGVMVAARNQKSFEELKELFKARKIEKEYLALVFGKLKNKKGVIEKPIARAKSYKKQVIAGAKTRAKFRPAVTEYEALEEYENYSLVKVAPKTGRMHQIRVHLASLGNPVVGDKKYKFKNLKAPKEIRRQLLHAQSLKFKLFGKKYFFQSEIPWDFSEFISSLDS